MFCCPLIFPEHCGKNRQSFQVSPDLVSNLFSINILYTNNGQFARVDWPADCFVGTIREPASAMGLVRAGYPPNGFSLVETSFAVALVGIFFVGLFSLNSQCLYFVNSSRELLTASGVLQTRMEQLRNVHWSQISNSAGTYIAGSNVLGTAVSGESTLGSVTEVITVDSYPTATGTPLQVTRASNGTVTVNQTNSSIATGDMATITIQLTWMAAPGARSRSVALSTIWAENTR
jgi:hypothetical protein